MRPARTAAAAFLAACLVFGMVPPDAGARVSVGPEKAYADPVPGDLGSTVSFGGHDWIVIGVHDEGSSQAGGANAGPAGTRTLLGKAAWTDTLIHFNTDGGSGAYPYEGGELHAAMEAAYAGLTDVEKYLVLPRDIADAKVADRNDGALAAQGFWPLSVAEASALDAGVKAIEDDYWLRNLNDDLVDLGNPSQYSLAVFLRKTTGSVYYQNGVIGLALVRPAFYLSMEHARIDPVTGAVTHVHDYAAAVTPPTCTTPGHTTYTCRICGDVYTGAATAALGHDWGGWTVVTAPTATADGLAKRVCRRDPTHVETQAIPATGDVATGSGVATDSGVSDGGDSVPPGGKDKRKKVKVVFRAGDISVTKKLASGAKYGTLPSVSKKGHRFAGWYTKRSGGKRITPGSIVGTKNVTLYARWQARYGRLRNAAVVRIHARASASSGVKGYAYRATRMRLVKKVDRPGTAWDWYKVSCRARDGKAVTGYVDTAYVRLYWR
jgi:uncharacterized repeat protein (TIGR02543 family)